MWLPMFHMCHATRSPVGFQSRLAQEVELRCWRRAGTKVRNRVKTSMFNTYRAPQSPAVVGFAGGVVLRVLLHSVVTTMFHNVRARSHNSCISVRRRRARTAGWGHFLQRRDPQPPCTAIGFSFGMHSFANFPRSRKHNHT